MAARFTSGEIAQTKTCRKRRRLYKFACTALAAYVLLRRKGLHARRIRRADLSASPTGGIKCEILSKNYTKLFINFGRFSVAFTLN